MAKILTGPLAAGISGKLGPLVFRQTFFGQVVQAKAKGRPPSTAAELANVGAFGDAARFVPLALAPNKDASRWVARLQQRSLSAAVIQAARAAVTSGATERCLHWNAPFTLSVTAIADGGATWDFTVTWETPRPVGQLGLVAREWPVSRGRYRSVLLNSTSQLVQLPKANVTPPLMVHILLPGEEPPPPVSNPAALGYYLVGSFFTYRT